MGYNFKEVMNKPERFAPGHRMCAGCGATICARNVLRGLHEMEDKRLLVVQQDVLSFIFPVSIRAWERQLYS